MHKFEQELEAIFLLLSARPETFNAASLRSSLGSEGDYRKWREVNKYLLNGLETIAPEPDFLGGTFAEKAFLEIFILFASTWFESAEDIPSLNIDVNQYAMLIREFWQPSLREIGITLSFSGCQLFVLYLAQRFNPLFLQIFREYALPTGVVFDAEKTEEEI